MSRNKGLFLSSSINEQDDTRIPECSCWKQGKLYCLNSASALE